VSRRPPKTDDGLGEIGGDLVEVGDGGEDFGGVLGSGHLDRLAATMLAARLT
jgi:hypothetical protein